MEPFKDCIRLVLFVLLMFPVLAIAGFLDFTLWFYRLFRPITPEQEMAEKKAMWRAGLWP